MIKRNSRKNRIEIVPFLYRFDHPYSVLLWFCILRQVVWHEDNYCYKHREFQTFQLEWYFKLYIIFRKNQLISKKKSFFLPLLSITTCSELYLKFHLEKFSNDSEVRYFWVFPNFLRITDPILFKSSFAWTWTDIEICLVFGVKSHNILLIQWSYCRASKI